MLLESTDQQITTLNTSSFQTTIVGYGRYGNNYIGPKYAKSGCPWQTVAVVDPLITPYTFKQSILGQKQPQISLFQSFSEWYENYFDLLDDNQKARQVVEIALKAEFIYEQVLLYIKAGVKHFILPKPVVVNQQELFNLTEIVQKYQVKAAVASQWHYCQIPKIIQREIKRIHKLPKTVQSFLPWDKSRQANLPSLYKVEINFSKENGLAYATTPPLLELPHALQILTTVGLIDFNKHVPEVSGTDTMVNVIYRPQYIKQGVHIHASNDLQPDLPVKSQFPLWDIQERSLKIYSSSKSLQPDLEVDLWIKFDSSGELAIRPGKLVITDTDEQGLQQRLALNFVEDQLLEMNLKIYEAFQQSFTKFQNDSRILSLQGYNSVGQQIMLIQQLWETVKNSGVSSSKDGQCDLGCLKTSRSERRLYAARG